MITNRFINTLLKYGDSESTDALIKSLKVTESKIMDVREDIVNAIGTLGSNDQVLTLVELYEISRTNHNRMNEMLTLTLGSIGDDSEDDQAKNKAFELMIHGRNEYVTTKSGTEYFIEAYTTPPQLVICGGGHVARALASLAKPLEFRLFITDDREEFANDDRFPEADIIISETPEQALPQLPINPNTFIVVATRGHRYDNVALLAAAKTSAKYVGLMGSKRKTILIYEDLIREGLEYDRLNEIRSPIGLDIRARTPEEIAISIMSEILMFRLGGSGVAMKLDKKQIDRIKAKVNRNSKTLAETT